MKDDLVDLYIDGVRQQVVKTQNLDMKWKEVVEIQMQTLPRLIAVKATNNPVKGPKGQGGLLASLSNAAGEDIAVTNTSWRTSLPFESGWERVEFRMQSKHWIHAKIIANHGEGYWAKHHTGFKHMLTSTMSLALKNS